MEIFMKLVSQDYEQLRRYVSTQSPAREAIDKATRIEHQLEGIQFKGYDVACDSKQALILLEIAKQCCPDVVQRIENAILVARSRKA
jgi:hypothetical protein